MNNREARALVAAYLSRKASDALRTHVGASLLRDHTHHALGFHPEGTDLARIRRAVRDLANELARRADVALPFPNEPEPPPTPDAQVTPEPSPVEAHHASDHSTRRARRRARGC